MIEVYLTGLTVGFSLILAIGAQNAFVLRQGLRGEHIGSVCTTCAVSDALLIFLGVAGFRSFIVLAPWLKSTMLYAGAGFLIWYGFTSLRSALASTEVLLPSSGTASSLSSVVTTCFALTWLNPHVYLDTVFLIGSISTQFPGRELIFAMGAMTSSVLFFFSLGYGAAALRPLFERPAAWRMLEGTIAITMWTIAIRLVTEI